MSKDMLKEIEANHQLSCENENDARYVWPERWTDAAQLVHKLQERVRELEQKTYCAYCGKEYPIDSDGSEIAEHIRMCEKHPIGIENARMREALKWYMDTVYEATEENNVGMDTNLDGSVRMRHVLKLQRDRGERARKVLGR